MPGRSREGTLLAVVWAVAVGATRVYLGVHWLDVLGGWLVMLLTLLAAGLFGVIRSGARGPQGAERQRERDQLRGGDDSDQHGPIPPAAEPATARQPEPLPR